jgi:3-dehydroquinate synthase
LGHTFGHAVEQCSDFTLLHGEAVAIGMATVTRAAVKRGICGEETHANGGCCSGGACGG